MRSVRYQVDGLMRSVCMCKEWSDVRLFVYVLGRPLEGSWGDVHRFYGNTLMHWTVPNTTDTTRVSLDFRAVPGYYLVA